MNQARAEEALIAGPAVIGVFKQHMVIEPIFSALSNRASNLVATAIGANQNVMTSCVSGHTGLPKLGEIFYSVQAPKWKRVM
jgi:hypothetical protein